VTHCIIMTSISVLYLKDLKERNIIRHKPSFGGEGGGISLSTRQPQDAHIRPRLDFWASWKI
jgi:hypothetical protein